jgi:hypothetical protein
MPCCCWILVREDSHFGRDGISCSATVMQCRHVYRMVCPLLVSSSESGISEHRTSVDYSCIWLRGSNSNNRSMYCGVCTDTVRSICSTWLHIQSWMPGCIQYLVRTSSPHFLVTATTAHQLSTLSLVRTVHVQHWDLNLVNVNV